MDFLALAEDRHALLDIGAQTGFMSALFARSRKRAASIISVEPDPQVLPILRRARELNSADDIDWLIEEKAVSNIDGRLVMPVSNWLYEPSPDAAAGEIEVSVATLAHLLHVNAWQPDIIKIDVESFEYEIICSSLAILQSLQPALQLEVHWQMLAARDCSPDDFLAPLADIGYRGIRRRYRDIDAWRRAGRREAVSRMSLTV
jgi:FkbM family methyltransferase